MSKKLGFIGCGNMGKAMIHGVLASGKAQASDILASAKTEGSREKNAAELGIRLTADNKSVAEFADILFLAVKPQYYEEVIAEIKDTVSDDEIIVSIAPGKSLLWFDEMFGKSLKVIRTMPNTPAMVGEGMMGVCANERVSQAELDTVLDLCSGFSKAEVIDEKLMDVVTAVSGSSPAYVFMFIEAMADAAVAGGMPRSQAYTFAAQAVLGSAKMVLETGKHPGELKDMVCTPRLISLRRRRSTISFLRSAETSRPAISTSTSAAIFLRETSTKGARWVRLMLWPPYWLDATCAMIWVAILQAVEKL